ncbi:MAG: efflux RND transporter permease subunit [Pseudomonadota bacterium]
MSDTDLTVAEADESTRLSNAFFTNGRLSVLLVLFIVAMGFVAISSLARQEDPTLTERYANVTTFLPGATASRVEALISEPIETRLREVPEISELSSSSRAGYSVISIELYDAITQDQVDAIWSEVRDKLAEVAAELPANTSPPKLELNQAIASTLTLALRWRGEGQPQLALLSRLAEALEIELANQPGTKSAETFGEIEEEVLVTVDPYRLASAGLTAADVSRLIAGADTKDAAGRLRSSATDLLVEVDAELSSIERIGRIPLKQGNSDGASGLLRVSDLASVTRHQVDPPRTMALHRGERVIFVNAKMEPGLIIDRWIANALRVVEDFRSELPPAIELSVVYNQNDYTGARMDTLLSNLLLALAIVMVVLLFFMGARSALTVGLALPLSGGMVLAGMYALDIPLHQMSVTGLIISLGLLIDNAIVVVEDYKLRRRHGSSIAGAISAATRHLFIPLGASTLTTIFAFTPIILAPGGVGDFTGTIGVSVSLAIGSSFLLAMTIVPAIAGFLERRFPPQAEGPDAPWWQGGFHSAALTARYRASLDLVLRRPWLGIAIGCVLPVIGFVLAPTLTQQFFPPVDRDQFQVQLALPVQASIEETRSMVMQADGILRETEGVEDVFWSVGEGPPRTYYNVVLNNDGVASFAAGWVNTTSAATTLRILPQLQAELSRALPGAEVLALPFEQGPPVNAPIELRIIGPEFATLRRLGESLRLMLSQEPEVTATRASLSVTEPKLVFEPNESAAAIAGLQTGDLPNLLASALVGLPAGSVQEGNSKLDVRVRLPDGRRDDVADLAALPIATASGGLVPLEQLGRWQLRPTPTAIDRYQGERVSNVRAFLTPFTLPAGVMARFQERLEASDFQLPPGYRLSIGGEAEARSDSVGNILSIFIFCAIGMVTVVVLSLNSFKQAGVIGLVGLLSVGLALFGVRLFSWPMGYTAFIGTLGMVGLAINGAIIVLSALRANAAAVAGDRERSLDVVVDATRHIVSTTATTIGGFIPLILFGGTFWPPLATAIAGGVGGSALLALYTVPAMFHRAARKRADAQSSQAAARDAPPAPEALQPLGPRASGPAVVAPAALPQDAA